MAKEISKIALALEILESAESSIRSARQLLIDATGEKSTINKKKLEEALEELKGVEFQGDDQIIEGVFDGEKMIDVNQKTYVVPANYASKSKLIPGDVLKLTIKVDGTFLYKQISPAPRKHVKGTLTYEDGKYKVLAEGKLYNVILASVTYYKGEVGDKVSLIIPVDKDSDWGAIDVIISDGE